MYDRQQTPPRPITSPPRTNSVPVQRRFGFDDGPTLAAIAIDLVGVFVTVETTPPVPPAAISALLDTVAINVDIDEAGTRFHVKYLTNLARLKNVTVTPSQEIEPLWKLAKFPSDGNRPVHVDVFHTQPSTLVVSWTHAALPLTETLPAVNAPALLNGSVAFVATTAAFDLIGSASSLPVVVGRAAVNADWFVEITTTAPQLCESAPLPGLFRVDNAST